MYFIMFIKLYNIYNVKKYISVEDDLSLQVASKRNIWGRRLSTASGEEVINHSNKEWRMNMDVYKECPVLENDIYKIRLIEEKDSEDLLKVYSDK